jgi:hypothetical protein
MKDKDEEIGHGFLLEWLLWCIQGAILPDLALWGQYHVGGRGTALVGSQPQFPVKDECLSLEHDPREYI